MSWIELPALRNQRSRTYQDDTNPLKRAWSGTLAALHYESELDSGIYDAEVGMTPARVDTLQFDGWRINLNSWHYALGKDIANHGDQDGWVGFGGRKGAHWFKFRLLRIGYLHWPTRTWDDIGGVPDYDRDNLTQQTNIITIGPNDDQIPVQTVATWSRIWTTPGDGNLSAHWAADPDRLKEEVVINQAAREWVATNRPPTTPANQTYFGFVFRLDWSDIPRTYRAGLLQDLDGDFTDDGQPIELRDSLDRLLAFMPISDVRVPRPYPELDEREPLRKRFWKDPDGNHYLLIGVRCDILNAMTPGDLIFDPTVDKQIAAGADDGWWTSVDFDATGDYCAVGVSGADVHSFFRWTGVTIAGTIDTSYIELYGWYSEDPAALMKVWGVDEDNPDAPTTYGEAGGDPLTASSVNWDIIAIYDWNESPSLNAIFQELVDSYTISNDAVMVQVKDDGGTTVNGFRSREFDTSLAAKLHIEYAVVVQIPRYGFTNFQVPGVV